MCGDRATWAHSVCRSQVGQTHGSKALDSRGQVLMCNICLGSRIWQIGKLPNWTVHMCSTQPTLSLCVTWSTLEITNVGKQSVWIMKPQVRRAFTCRLAFSSATCLRAAAARASAESALSLSSLKATVAPADPVHANIFLSAGLLVITCAYLHTTTRSTQVRNAWH